MNMGTRRNTRNTRNTAGWGGSQRIFELTGILLHPDVSSIATVFLVFLVFLRVPSPHSRPLKQPLVVHYGAYMAIRRIAVPLCLLALSSVAFAQGPTYSKDVSRIYQAK